MRTLSDFKKRLKKGIKIETIFHQFATKRNETGVLMFEDINKGIREVNKVQTNSFSLLTNHNGEVIDSWCEYPKASEIKFPDENTAIIYTSDFRNNSETYNQLIPCLTYKFIAG